MNSHEVLRIVDAIHRDKNIGKDIVFEGIEQAILSAGRKHYPEDSEIEVRIDRENGEVSATLEGEKIPQEELDYFGRIDAQTAKQVMIQKIREAERDALYDEFSELRTHLVHGTITRVDHGAATVALGKLEALLPRSEQIRDEQHRTNERVRAIILDVRKAGSRVKVILSRTHAEFVRRLFESEIPEVDDGIIEVKSIAREAGFRTKVAVSCNDSSIDPVGACVGVRGSRIRSIVNELSGEGVEGERIDIVRWNDSLQVLIPNALQPAEVEDVILCPMLGRVLVLVREDQLSLAIGRRGQNVRLASKLVGWDIEVMTREELDEQLDRSVAAFSTVPHIAEELAEVLVSQGFFSFEDLSVIEPDQLQELSGFTEEQIDEVVAFAEVESVREEREADIRKQQERIARQLAKQQPPPEPEAESNGETATDEEAAAEETATAEAGTDEAVTDEVLAEETDDEEMAEEVAATDEAATDESIDVAAESPEVAESEPTEPEAAAPQADADQTDVAEDRSSTSAADGDGPERPRTDAAETESEMPAT